jgi:hypothetical protein
LPIQVLDPFRIDIAIKDDPVSLTAFITDIINNLAQDVGNNKRGHLRREGPEIIIGMVIAWSFRKGLRSSNEICRVIGLSEGIHREWRGVEGGPGER